MTAPTSSVDVFDYNQTGTANTGPRPLAWLAIAIALARIPSPSLMPSLAEPSAGNARITVRVAGMEEAILLAISDLHDRLIAKSTDLPPEAAAVLYANLWDLYVD
jgi:hypothetical protein